VSHEQHQRNATSLTRTLDGRSSPQISHLQYGKPNISSDHI
jgi:hypothetical protein